MKKFTISKTVTQCTHFQHPLGGSPTHRVTVPGAGAVKLVIVFLKAHRHPSSLGHYGTMPVQRYSVITLRCDHVWNAAHWQSSTWTEVVATVVGARHRGVRRVNYRYHDTLYLVDGRTATRCIPPWSDGHHCFSHTRWDCSCRIAFTACEVRFGEFLCTTSTEHAHYHNAIFVI